MIDGGIQTPVLSAAGNTEPNIDGFQTRFSGHVDAGSPLRWLRTSPEYPLKRLLAAGVGDCYELGRVFRNGEAGGRHKQPAGYARCDRCDGIRDAISRAWP